MGVSLTSSRLRNLARRSLTMLRQSPPPKLDRAAIRRLAIVSSPRSGNTWVRFVLADALELEHIGINNYVDAPESLPNNFILQLHWYREPNFQRFLRANGFQVVVLARHPLDVLISSLHFARLERKACRWLEGNCELTPSLFNAAPASSEFLEYATSWGAENLLSVTYQWWHDNQAIKVRYEDLVCSPLPGFSKVIANLNGSSVMLSAALEKFSLPSFQAMQNRHGWKGRPGLWRELMPFPNARQIYERHRAVFDTLGYSVDRTSLTEEEALRNWEEMKVDPQPRAPALGAEPSLTPD
jgi:hypothetical protein